MCFGGVRNGFEGEWWVSRGVLKLSRGVLKLCAGV